jgi:hypothetical protein
VLRHVTKRKDVFKISKKVDILCSVCSIYAIVTGKALAGREIVCELQLHPLVMAAAWCRAVSGVLLLFLPTMLLAELRIAGTVEELDQGMTSCRLSD